MEGYAIPSGMPWHLTDDVYVPINSNGEFHWVLAVVALKERCMKVHDSMSSSRSNRKLSSELPKLSIMLPNYLELRGFLSKESEPTGLFLNVTKERTNLTHSKVSHVTGIVQQESSSL